MSTGFFETGVEDRLAFIYASKLGCMEGKLGVRTFRTWFIDYSFFCCGLFSSVAVEIQKEF